MIIAWLIRLVTGVQCRWIGCEPVARQRIYFANHGSHLDGPTIWASLPHRVRKACRLVAARDYWDANPWRRFLAVKVFRALLIRRGRISREDNPLDQMIAALEEAPDSLIIFPEGTRKDHDAEAELNPFKAGLYRLHQRFPDVELIPVYLRNLSRILPKGEILPAPVLSSISFGAPLEKIADESRSDFLARAESAVMELRKKEDQ